MREPTYFMLVALAPGEPLHGYAIAKRAEELSDGRVKITAGTLYGALDRLVDQGAIVLDSEGEVGGRKRRYYRITDHGSDELNAEILRMQQAVAIGQESMTNLSIPGLAEA